MILEHLREIKQRFLWVFITFSLIFCLLFFLLSDALVQMSLLYLKNTLSQSTESISFVFSTLPEAFLVKINLSLYGSVLLSFPLVQYQIWRFIAPGLYQREKNFILPIIFAIPLLFIVGACLLFYVILPNAFSFFFAVSQEVGKEQVQCLFRVSEYFSLIFIFLLAFGLSFQLPLLLIFLVKVSILSVHDLISFRRYAIVLIFTLAAFLTPPDVMSQIGLAIPLLALYEGTILYLRVRKNKDPDD